MIVKYMKNNLNITKPRYNEQILSVPWLLLKLSSTVMGLFPSKHKRS